MQYRIKPKTVNAWQWNGNNIDDAEKFIKKVNALNSNIKLIKLGSIDNPNTLIIEDSFLKIRLILRLNEYLIIKDKNEIYVEKKESFELNYEPVLLFGFPIKIVNDKRLKSDTIILSNLY